MVETVKPTYGEWLQHKCEPTCILEQFAEHQSSRRKMTKVQLTIDAERGDETLMDEIELRSMTEAWLTVVERHLKEAHGCAHTIEEIDS